MQFAPTIKRWLLPILTGAMLALALPPFDIGELGWIALIPLLFAAEGCRGGDAFRRGYVAGLVFFGMTTWWIVHVTLPGMVALVAFLALYFGAGAMWFAWLAGRGGAAAPTNISAAAVASAGWVTLEWVRGHFPLGGFGWNGLGVTQHRVLPLIQFASVTGVYGVSALVCFVNFAFYFTIRRFIEQLDRPGAKYRLSWEFYAAMALIALAFGHGAREIFPKEPKTTHPVRLALVQGNIPQTLKFDPAEKPMILERYRTLTETATLVQVDMIIWPETATPEPLRYDPESFALATNLAVQAHVPLLTGTIDSTPVSSSAEWFNSAILIRPDGSIGGVYRKLHLVPFGEYVPLRKIFPFMKYLTPITDSFERGREFTVFQFDELRFGVVICFEDTVPEVYRGFVQRGANFMVNLTNDAWLKDSPAAEIHLANAVFRAVENRRPLVRATNNGVTCIVNEHGGVNPHQRLTPFAQGTLICELPVPRGSGLTFYSEHGDWFTGGCAVLSSVAATFGWWRRKPAVRAS
jgi:apolipoprotein N-acyltransferase